MNEKACSEGTLSGISLNLNPKKIIRLFCGYVDFNLF